VIRMDCLQATWEKKKKKNNGGGCHLNRKELLINVFINPTA
jgi:hypothetical protein